MRDTTKRILFAGFIAISCVISLLPYYHLWWYDAVTHCLMGIWISVALIKSLGLGWRCATVYSALIIAWEIFEFVFRSFFLGGYRDTLTDLVVGLLTWVAVALVWRSSR
jgi:hypothetical protein